MRALRLMRRTVWLIAAVVVLAAAGFMILAGVADSDTSVTVTQGEFTLTCPVGTVAEGETLTCTLANTSADAQPWPVVAILHLSSDEDRALVWGELIDAAFDAHSPEADLDNGVEWIGDTLVGYSRFDWPGEAGADPSTTTTTAPAAHTRTVRVVANDDTLKEGSETLYIALGPDGSRGVGLLYNNRQKVTVTEDDAESSNNELTSLKLTAGSRDHTLSPTDASHSVTVEYGVTEATLTAEAAHRRATMIISASHGGTDIDLDGRGGTSAAVLSGEESLAVPLAVGTTAVTLTVTAEDGAASSHRIDIVRQGLGAATTVAVSTESFTLTCPATADRDSDATCTLVNTSSSSAPWPVVAIIHSSADPDRALVAEDPITPDTHPTYSKDVSLGTQQPQRADFNYGYGELFSGGSRTVYRTYGYEKFDWPGGGAAGASREVAIQLHAGDGSRTEVFYVAVAPSDYTGLSQLVDNKAPVLIAREVPDPSVSWVSAGSVTQTSAVVTVTVANPAPGGTALHLRHRPTASQGPWTTTSKPATTASAEFALSGLTAGTAYTVQASFDNSFATGTESATFTTSAPDDPTVGFGAATYSGVEGESIAVDLRLSAATTTPVRLQVLSKAGGVAVRGSDYSFGEAGQSYLDVEIPAGDTAYSFEIPTEDDDLLEGSEAFILEIRLLSRGVELGDDSEAVVTIGDNDEAGVIVSTAEVSIDEEGPSGSYTVKLASQPKDVVRVVAFSTNTWKVKVTPRAVDVRPQYWDVPHTFRVYGEHDFDAADEEVVIAHTVQAHPGYGYAGVAAAPVTVSVTDEHTPAVIALKGSIEMDLSVEPNVGTRARYGVHLTADPSWIFTEQPNGSYEPWTTCCDWNSHTVTIEATSSNPAVVSVSPASVTFTADTYDPQYFTVTGKTAGTASITHTIFGTDPTYTGTPLVVQSVAVTVNAPPAQQQAQQQAEQPAQQPAQQQAQQPAEGAAPGRISAPGPEGDPVPGPVEKVETFATADSLTVSWRAPQTGDPPTGYVLRLNQVGHSKGMLKTPVAKKTSVTYRDLEPGKTYKLWVRARNNAGKGPRTSVVITLPDPPTNPNQPTNQ